LGKVLKKRTGALTVSVEFERDGEGGSSENDLLVLSMRLRQMNVAAVFTPSLLDLKIFCKEQQKAKGDFPGPCPVIYYPPPSAANAAQVEEAAGAGAAAIVLRPATDLEVEEKASEGKMDVIWEVSSQEEMGLVVAAGRTAPIILIGTGAGEAEAADLVAALPADAIGVATVVRGQNEMELGRDKHKAGVKALLVRHACVGNADDDEGYARFAIETLTSKANPKFQITGLGAGGGEVDRRKSVGVAPSASNQQNTHHWRS